jgi:tRNA (mo5U34)-methyltransferase
MNMKELNKNDLDAIKAIHWWHRIPVGLVDGKKYYTPGDVDHGSNDHDFATMRFGLPRDLTGKTVLDIGAWDGYFSFEAEKRSAALVVASDMALSKPNKDRLEKGNWGGNKGFRLAHHLLGSKVRFIESSVFRIDEAVQQSAMNSIGDLSEKEYPFSYDVVLFYGVLYHLIEPFFALQKLASVTKGVALIETAISKGSGLTMELRPGFDNDPTNWWYPTIPCLQEMLLRAGFSRTEVVFNLNDVRATVAAYK